MVKIMVVDDDDKDLKNISDVLKKEGYEVDSVSNGVNAFDLLSKKQFDLILVDILMESLSGYDLLRLLKEKTNDTLIMYISVVPKNEVDMKGAAGFIQKPFTSESLLEEVNKVLK